MPIPKICPETTETTIGKIICEIHSRHKECRDGKLADYIPELAQANPDAFGIAVHTVDGHSYYVGDCEEAFTIQSVSKAFNYGLILDLHGYEAVSQKIGVEPSGEAFNSISLDPGTGRPLNPMINAGAIAATGMVEGANPDERFERIMKKLSDYAGRSLDVDEAVYQSESATGFRNRAIANLLRNFDIIGNSVDETAEVYFKQCAILVNCNDLALMGACLANGGVNPRTGVRVINKGNVGRVLSVMSTCGMYDYSGEWIFKVGLPAKSGVGGGIVGILPGQFGFSVFSPLLDEKGNSVRGLRVFAELSERFNLHLFNVPTISGEAIRHSYHLGQVDSKRQHPKAQQDAIIKYGSAFQVIEMQGDFLFGSAERLLRKISELKKGSKRFVVDFHRVSSAEDATVELIESLADDLADEGIVLILVDPNHLFDRTYLGTETTNVMFADELEIALENCEAVLIKTYIDPPAINGLFPFQDFEIFAGLSSKELTLIEDYLEMAAYKPNEIIVEEGSDADYLYLLAKGSVHVAMKQMNRSAESTSVRLAAFCPGVVFGDLGILQKAKRSARVVADAVSTCYLLPATSVAEMEIKHPAMYTKILRNLLLINVDRLRHSNREIASLKK